MYQFFAEPERTNWIPINPFTYYSIQAHEHRTKMPMKLAYAMTVHKSQGQTLTLGVIDFTNIERSLIVYY
jgi:hypothetical protein